MSNLSKFKIFNFFRALPREQPRTASAHTHDQTLKTMIVSVLVFLLMAATGYAARMANEAAVARG